ncbi:unnamed protein product [Acanthoscelides obtectus]|uniref:Uncharacterized protein n=1 Tax=Acanthoscelides obtectus TaxID=200917 RepID=A0A9P0LSS4_ACAOB|nr:unnamed protein product [Acanthoscelides obtectus]CAK1648596.1 hypothetical protein AOBTE_LOCUS15775 [Acanthoscelides obtectus]
MGDLQEESVLTLGMADDLTRGNKMTGRDSNREDAIGYVRLKREGTKCIAKCRVTPEHKVKTTTNHCTLV